MHAMPWPGTEAGAPGEAAPVQLRSSRHLPRLLRAVSLLRDEREAHEPGLSGDHLGAGGAMVVGAEG